MSIHPLLILDTRGSVQIVKKNFDQMKSIVANMSPLLAVVYKISITIKAIFLQLIQLKQQFGKVEQLKGIPLLNFPSYWVDLYP